MAKVLLIMRNSETYSHQKLLATAQDLGHQIHVLNTKNFCSLPQEDNYDLVVHRDSGISFDDIDILLTMATQSSGAKCVNDPQIIQSLRGKDRQYLWFLKNKLPHTPTLLQRGSPKRDMIFPATNEFVLKTTRGNQGLGVMLINGRDSLFSILEANHARGDQSYILQPKMNFVSEWRILLLNNEVLGAIKKTSLEDFRANSKRSKGQAIKTSAIPDELLQLTNKVIELLPNQFLGLDFGITEDGALLIEINSTPGFESFDKLHDTNIAKRFWESYL